MLTKVKEFSQKNLYTSMLLALLVLLLLFFSITKGGTLWSLGTWNGIFMQFPEYGVMTIGVMFCFISGNIDMSFVALGNFACILGVQYMAANVTEGMGNGQIIGVMLVAVLIVMVIGAIGGVINGLLISLLNIPPVMADRKSTRLNSSH